MMIKKAETTIKRSEAKIQSAASRVRRPEDVSPYVSSYNHIIQLHRTIGNRGVEHLYRSGLLQAKGGEQGTTALPQSIEASRLPLKDSGKPLSAPEREFFEPRFGVDLGGVRMHTSAEAGRLSLALGAEAFTLGPHIYFSSGSYNPETSAGRRLLAHELTHVAQQSGTEPSNLGIQCKLLVTGKKTDIKAFIDLLEPASGFTLKHDPKTHEVSIAASRLKPPSYVLASRLATIIDDPKQDAELDLGRRQPGVGFGAFPFDEGPLIQRIDIDDVERLEARAPGNGVAFLIHEIVENYAAHDPKMLEFRRSVVFSALHREALEAERLVAEELVGIRGGRVADSVTTARSGVIRMVDDYENYFLVIEHKGGVLFAARRVSRVNVSKYAIGGFSRGSIAVPTAARPKITSVVDDLVANPTATVLIKSGDVDPAVAQQRAEEVRDAILAAGKGHKGFDLRSERNFNLSGFGLIDLPGSSGSVMISVDMPDIAVEAERGRLVKTVLSGRGRR
jgi:hypothetical protein